MAAGFAATHLGVFGEDVLYEVVNGQPREIPAMGMLQGWIASTLLVILGEFVRQHQLGKVISETLFVLDRDADLKRRPDVAFVSRTRWPGRPQQTEAWDVIPDLAVEVVSPTNTADEVLEKIDEYFRFGVRLVWVIYCEPLQVYVYRSAKDVRVLRPGDDLEGGDVLPGFRLPIDTLAEDVGQEAK